MFFVRVGLVVFFRFGSVVFRSDWIGWFSFGLDQLFFFRIGSVWFSFRFGFSTLPFVFLRIGSCFLKGMDFDFLLDNGLIGFFRMFVLDDFIY